MIVRAEATPGTHAIDAWLALIFPDGNLVTVLCRGDWPQPAEGVRAGRLELDAAPPMQAWNVACTDTALVFPTAGAAGMPGKGDRRGAATQVDVAARLEATMEAHGRVERETAVSPEGFVRTVSAGRYEQVVRMSGTVKAGARTVELDGVGLRERLWGPSAIDPGMSLGVVFDDGLAISARAAMRGDRLIRSGWVRDDAGLRPATALRLESDQDARAVSEVRAHFEDGSDAYDLVGEVIATMPGREGGLKSRRCVVRYRCGTRYALGFAELIDA